MPHKIAFLNGRSENFPNDELSFTPVPLKSALTARVVPPAGMIDLMETILCHVMHGFQKIAFPST